MDMQTGWNENRALLRGTAAAEPVLSHETHGVCPARRTGSMSWSLGPCWSSGP